MAEDIGPVPVTPITAREQIAEASGLPTRRFQKFLRALWDRTGGYADAVWNAAFQGIANVAAMRQLQFDLDDARTENASLRAQLAARDFGPAIDELRISLGTIQNSITATNQRIQQAEVAIREDGEQSEVAAVSAAQSSASRVAQLQRDYELILEGDAGLTTDQVAEGSSLYYQDDRARGALSGFGAIAYNPVTGEIDLPTRTGWGVPTGTATRSTFDTASVTLPQLAERVKALLDDLKSVNITGA